jgi:hypothetical protein
MGFTPKRKNRRGRDPRAPEIVGGEIEDLLRFDFDILRSDRSAMRSHARNAGFFGVARHMHHGSHCLRVVSPAFSAGVGNEQHRLLVRYRCDGRHVRFMAGRKYISRGRRRRNGNSALIHSAELAGTHQRSHADAAGRCGTRGSPPSSMRVPVHFDLSVSSSSNVRGQSAPKRRDRARSASSLPAVWHRAQ